MTAIQYITQERDNAINETMRSAQIIENMRTGLARRDATIKGLQRQLLDTLDKLNKATEELKQREKTIKNCHAEVQKLDRELKNAEFEARHQKKRADAVLEDLNKVREILNDNVIK